MPINNPVLYNAAIAGAGGGGQERWTSATAGFNFTEYCNAIEAFAIAVDSTIPVIAGISDSDIDLLQSICHAVMSNRNPTSADPATYMNVALPIAALFTDMRGVLTPVPPLAGVGGAVPSVFARVGHIVAMVDDYLASQVDNDSTVTGGKVNDALDTLKAAILALVVGVSSVYGRGGAVVAVNGDTKASFVTNDSGVVGANVGAALDTLATGLATKVTSVFGRSGVVGAAIGDYKASEINNDSLVTGTRVSDALNALLNPATFSAGVLRAGTAPFAATGLIRVSTAAQATDPILVGRNPANTADTAMVQWAGSGTSLVFGWNTTEYMQVGPNSISFVAGGAVRLGITGTTGIVNIPLILSLGSGTMPTTGTIRVGFGAMTPIMMGRNTANSADTQLMSYSGDALYVGAGNGYIGISTGGISFTLAAALAYSFSASLMTAPALALGTTPATTGIIRLASVSTIKGRNTANTADLTLFDWSSDNLGVGSGTANRIAFGAGSFEFFGSSIRAAFISSGGSFIFDRPLYFNSAGATDAKLAHLDVNNGSRFWVCASGAVSGNTNGAALWLSGGRRFGTGFRGASGLVWNTDNTDLTNAAAAIGLGLFNVVGDNRVVSLARGAVLTATDMPVNTGDLVMHVGNAATDPTADATNGFILYSSAGKAAFRLAGTNVLLGGSAGSLITTLNGIVASTLTSTGLTLPGSLTLPNYIALGAAPVSLTGLIRVPANSVVISARNSANTTDQQLLGWSGDVMYVGAGNDFVSVVANQIAVIVGGINAATFSTIGASTPTLRLGTTPATTGLIRVPHGNVLLAGRNNAASADAAIISWGVGAADRAQFGDPTTYHVQTNAAAVYIYQGVTPCLRIGTTQVTIYASNLFRWMPGIVDATITQVNDNINTRLWLHAGGAVSGNASGSATWISGGMRAGAGLRGAAGLFWNTDDTNPTNAAAAVGVGIYNVLSDNRVVSLARGAVLTATDMPANTGDLVTHISDAAIAPTADALNGHIYYSSGAKPAWRFNATNLRLDGHAATASAGGGVLPATPEEFLTININGNERKIPCYLT